MPPAMGMRIGLDYDSVITDSREIKSCLTRRRFGLAIPHRFLFIQEYNLHKRLPEGIRRVYSWPDLCRKIKEVQDGTR